MKSKRGRRPLPERRVKMTLRFRGPFAEFIRKKAKEPGMTQVLVCEQAISIAGKGIKFKVEPIGKR